MQDERNSASAPSFESPNGGALRAATTSKTTNHLFRNSKIRFLENRRIGRTDSATAHRLKYIRCASSTLTQRNMPLHSIDANGSGLIANQNEDKSESKKNSMKQILNIHSLKGKNRLRCHIFAMDSTSWKRPKKNASEYRIESIACRTQRLDSPYPLISKRHDGS
jgi:hypothetical protein